MIRYFIFLILSAGLILGCSREKKDFTDLNINTNIDNSKNSTDNLFFQDFESNPIGLGLLPHDFYDHSAHNAGAELIIFNNNTNELGLYMHTSNQSNDSRQFNGEGAGNMALLGNTSHTLFLFNEFLYLEIDSYSTDDSSLPQIHFLVDPYCDNSETHVLSSSKDSYPTGEKLDEHFTKLTYSSNAPLWISKQDILDPLDSSLILVPTIGNTPVDLNEYFLAFPNACFVNRTILNEEFPKDTILSSILISIGSSQHLTQSSLLIKRIKINEIEYNSTQW